jgi:ABC-type branched-subunit amino acid transport system substrate-binding protein
VKELLRPRGRPFFRALAAGALAISLAACRPSRPIIDPAEPGARVTIGAALPLSGRLKAIGEGGRDAVRLAAGELDERADPRIQIAVRDTQGDAAGAAKAVEDLVLGDGAIAIVGPLIRSEATAAAEKAQELGVPLVALTSDRQVTSAGAYVFHAGLSPEDEMDALVSHAMDELRLTTFAVLHPRIEYGERMLQLFRERVKEKGGTIRAIESYEAEETTFTEPIQRLVQRDAPAERADYRSAIAKCKDARDSYRKARCEREERENLPPIIEFDAIFIPDGHEKIALIAPAVVAEDIIVERDPTRLKQIEKTLGREVEPITLLGTSAWNSPELAKKAGRAVESAIFADAYFDAATEDEITSAFVAGFRKHFGRRPQHQDALLYDATRFIVDLLAAERPATTNELRNAMHELRGFRGVTGEISFADGTQARRKLKILTIEKQAIREVRRDEG